MANIFFSIPLIVLILELPAISSKCSRGRKNGILDPLCLMEQVEKKSDNGKSIFKMEDSQYEVNITFTLLSVDELTDDGTFQARVRILSRWFDPILSWNSTELEKKQDLIVMPASLARWPKYIVIYDQDISRSMVQKMADFPVTIRSNGRNEHLVEVTTLTDCSLDTTYFPRDVQTCSINLAPLPLGVSGIATFNVDYKDDTELFDGSNDWPLEKDTDFPKGIIVGQKDNDYVFMQVHVRRNPHSINIALVTPMYIFSFVASVIYLLPPDTGDRIGSSITMVLTIAVTMLAVKDLLPSSDPTKPDPYFSTFTMIVFAQTMILFIETILILSIWNSEKTIRWHLKRRTKDISDQRQTTIEISYKKAAEKIDAFFFVGSLIVSVISVTVTIMGIRGSKSKSLE